MQSPFDYLPRGDVTLIREGAVVRSWTGKTDAARGNRVAAAKDAALAGDLVVAGPGDFLIPAHESASVGIDSTGVHWAGMGRGVTRFYATDSIEIFTYRGTATLRDLTIAASDTDVAEPFLVRGTGDATLINVELDASGAAVDKGALWINDSTAAARCIGCKLAGKVTSYGALDIFSCDISEAKSALQTLNLQNGADVFIAASRLTNAGTGNANLILFGTSGTIALDLLSCSLALSAGTGALSAGGGFTGTYTLGAINCLATVASASTGWQSAANAMAVTVTGGKVSGSSAANLKRTSGTLSVDGLSYDPTKTSGTITHTGRLPLFSLTATEIGDLPAGHGLLEVYDSTNNMLKYWTGSAFAAVA